jgi:hypothetical protein
MFNHPRDGRFGLKIYLNSNDRAMSQVFGRVGF